MKKQPLEISIIEALAWIVGSLLITAVVFHKGIYPNFFMKENECRKNPIEYVMQTGPSKEALHSEYFMELLGLSADHPCFFSEFNIVKAQEKLLRSPVIAKVLVKKIAPNMVYIDYTVRRPFALAADFCNVAFDKEAVLFPVHPFVSPKNLTEVYLGEEGLKDSFVVSLGTSVTGKYTVLAFAILDHLAEVGKDLFFVKRIDVSNAYASTLGKREIIVSIENEIYLPGEDKPVLSNHFLRLSLRQYSQEIANYLQVRGVLLESDSKEVSLLQTKILKDRVVDLRLPQLAFIQ